MIASGGPVVKDQWNTTIGPSTYLYVGDNGTLYAFDSNNISSIAVDGSVKWTISIPDNWTRIDSDYDFGMMSGFRSRSKPALASYNGILYVYAKLWLDQNASPVDLQNNITPITPISSVMAISPDGSIMWNTLLGTNGPQVEAVLITASNDKVYVYYGALAVFSNNGSLLYRIDNIMAPPSMDEQGDIYAIKYDSNGTWDPIYGYTGTYNTIVAYHPDGSLWWQKEMKEPLQDRYLDVSMNPVYSALPAYKNGTLYVPLKKSLVALDRNGTELWSVAFKWDIHPFLDMLFDSQNNIYLVVNTRPIAGNDWIVYEGAMVSPDGKCLNYTIMRDRKSPISVNNGIGYYVYINNWIDLSTGGILNPSNLTDLVSQGITAVDLKTGQALWNFTVPTNSINGITLDLSNIKYMDEITADMKKYQLYYGPQSLAIPSSASASIEYNEKHPELQALNKSAIGPWKVAGAGTMKILPRDKLPRDNVVYVSYFMYNYEYPASLMRPPYNDGSDAYKYPHAAVFNRSELAYVSGILALDNTGRLLWNRPTDSMVTTVATNNSTIYYGTGDGKLFATQVNIAVGFALAALAYLFLRFVCVGAVARAKARLSKNENRNLVLDFIARNPGSSLYEITRGTGVNLGTVRYHLFILGLNHKIVASQTDGKYVRYFTNSGTYSKEEQLVLSLMRRDAMGRVLGLMLEKPGISNVEIARELDIKESVVCRCVKELSEKGIITKEPPGKGCSVEEAHRGHVAMALRRIQGE